MKSLEFATRDGVAQDAIDHDALMRANAMNTLETARWLLSTYGIHCIDYKRGAKGPTEDGWQHVRAEGDDLTRRFADLVNIGVMTGAASNGIFDVDLDCPEAVALATHLLPPTGLAWGRPAKNARPTHLLYRLADTDARFKQRIPFQRQRAPEEVNMQEDEKSEKREMLVELRGSGHQSMCPPSRHPGGDRLAWMAVGEPASVTSAALAKAVGQVAAAVLIVRNWPGSGVRHDYVMALAGVFARYKVPEEDAIALIEAAGETAEDGDPYDRAAAIRGTYHNFEADNQITGIPTAKAFFQCEDDFDLMLRWLGVTKEEAQAENRKDSERQIVEALATAIELFHTPSGEPYAQVQVNGHVEILPIAKGDFEAWLARWVYETTGMLCNASMMSSLLLLLAGRARYDGVEAEVYTRIAHVDGKTYISLANEQREMVEIDAEGWRIVESAPVRFRRTNGMKALPRPERGGSLDVLRPLVNLPTEELWIRAVAWLVGCFQPHGPLAVAAVHGEEGSGKSSLTARLCGLVDPSTVEKASVPQTEEDIAIMAKNTFVVAFDNMSGMSHRLSDVICRLATGGGLRRRKLYANDEEMLFYAKRPVIFNGIPTIATNGDLLSRMLLVELPSIEETLSRTEDELDGEFAARLPQLLGALYDVVSIGLRERASVRLERKPRMADFAQWVVACGRGLGWSQDEVLELFDSNREANISVQIEGSLVATVIMEFMETHVQFEGLTSELDAELRATLTVAAASSDDTLDTSRLASRLRSWPRDAKQLGAQIKRAASLLRRVGIIVEGKHTKHGTRWTLSRAMRAMRAMSESSAAEYEETEVSKMAAVPEPQPQTRLEPQAQQQTHNRRDADLNGVAGGLGQLDGDDDGFEG